MEHYIIVKFNNKGDLKNLVKPIRELFNKSLDIEGVEKVDIYISCLALDNRHDLMIKMQVTTDGLQNFDNSYIHKEWKEKYSKYIDSKTIFDCEL